MKCFTLKLNYSIQPYSGLDIAMSNIDIYNIYIHPHHFSTSAAWFLYVFYCCFFYLLKPFKYQKILLFKDMCYLYFLIL